MPKTTPPMTQEEKLAALKTMIRDNVTASRPRAVRRNPNQMRLVEHAHLVRDSLVECVAWLWPATEATNPAIGAADDLQIFSTATTWAPCSNSSAIAWDRLFKHGDSPISAPLPARAERPTRPVGCFVGVARVLPQRV